MRLFTRKSLKNRSKIKTLSLYCITLALFCQALAVLNFADARATSEQNPVKLSAEDQIADLSFGPITSAGGDVNAFYFQDFVADYYLSRAEDGSSRLRVVEKFSAMFPETDQNHGITRVIPFTNQSGKNLTLPSTESLDIQVKHNGMSEKPYKIVAGDDAFTVYLGSPSEYVHGFQLYELEYEFIDVITAPEDNPRHQELYWDTNGTGWAQTFDRLTARVHFVGEDVRQAFDGEVSCYVGRYGENGSDRCYSLKTADGIEFYAYDLAARENLTFDLEFNADAFTLAPPQYSYLMLITVIVEGIIAAVILWIIFILHHQTKAKRDYYHGLFVTPEYAPPADFTVAEMAENYIGQKILGSSKVATLMELAVAHKVELSKLGTESQPQWTVKILSTDLKPEQTDVVKLLAGRDVAPEVGQEILIKSHGPDSTLVRIDRRFSTTVTKNLRDAGLYEPKPSSARAKAETKNQSGLCDGLLVLGIVWIVVILVALPITIGFCDSLPSYVSLYGGAWIIIASILAAILIAVVAFAAYGHYAKYYSHTMDGLKWSRYLDGLRMYIKMAEQDRIAFLQSVNGADSSHQGIVRLYEKLLPYAVVFRLEKSWLAEMEKYYEFDDVSEPSWYSGSLMFSAHDFGSAMRAFGAATIASDYSSSGGGSSSSSGGGGGGHSGGGGGGGGGGGW